MTANFNTEGVAVKFLAIFFLAFVIIHEARADLLGGDSVDAGEAGYCIFSPIWSRFVGAKDAYSDVIFGPTNHGQSLFNYSCVSVDLKEHPVSEPFDILTKYTDPDTKKEQV